jgi:UDP-N-acetyl-D-mannosaminuronic acid dehydrogenase
MKIAVVGGAGHVGLPFSVVLASKGFDVTAYDISHEAVAKVNAGKFPFTEEGGEELLNEVLKSYKFKASTDAGSISDAETVVVVIGTPVNEHLSPDPNSVVKHVEAIIPQMKSARLLILRSTLFPGVTEKVLKLLSNYGLNIEVAYCPERIVEGQALREINSLPQIIGATTENAFRLAKDIFDLIGVESFQTTPGEAELAKLFTNVWRYIKFAAANQFWMMANDYGIDYENVRIAISRDYPRASDLPKSGFAAGPCLFKDTMQLAALVQQNFPLGNSAMMINEGIPGYVVERLKTRFDLSNLRVGILGMAFKANVDDTRSSLAYKLRKLLMFECKEVICADPYVEDTRMVEVDYLLENVDLVIIGAPHSNFKELEFDKPVIDIWGLLDQGVKI